jgi:hypothetical protein
VHLANRESIDTIFMLDRRDFGVLRPARGKRFRMVPWRHVPLLAGFAAFPMM